MKLTDLNSVIVAFAPGQGSIKLADDVTAVAYGWVRTGSQRLEAPGIAPSSVRDKRDWESAKHDADQMRAANVHILNDAMPNAFASGLTADGAVKLYQQWCYTDKAQAQDAAQDAYSAYQDSLIKKAEAHVPA